MFSRFVVEERDKKTEKKKPRVIHALGMHTFFFFFLKYTPCPNFIRVGGLTPPPPPFSFVDNYIYFNQEI